MAKNSTDLSVKKENAAVEPLSEQEIAAICDKISAMFVALDSENIEMVTIYETAMKLAREGKIRGG